ncbi:MAG TPA: hypothetical protein VFE70_04075 [Candidatus Elarobacter sp.]|nr:hypothetical protein [Candidatus Elarobacter sp.]
MKSLRSLTVTSLVAFAAATLLWSGAALTNAALGFTPAASAQGTGGSTDRSGGRARFAKMLMSIRPPLSGAQKDLIRKMREQMRAESKNQPQPADPDARRARFNGFMDKIRGVLTPAQRADFDAKRAAMRANQGQH